jgi:hypothetical protein
MNANPRAQFYISPPLSHRYFLFLDPATGGVLDASIAHPYITPIFSPLAAGLLCVLGPAAVILAMAAWRIRSFWDANNALLGLVYSVLTSTAFQVIVKTVIGGLRPHFLAVCRPEVGDAKAGIGFEGTTFDRYVPFPPFWGGELRLRLWFGGAAVSDGDIRNLDPCARATGRESTTP